MRNYISVRLGVFHKGRVRYAIGYWPRVGDVAKSDRPELFYPIRSAVSDWLDWYSESMRLDSPIGVSVLCKCFTLPDLASVAMDTHMRLSKPTAAARFEWLEEEEEDGRHGERQ